MNASAKNDETSQHGHFDFEPDINDLFGASIALTVFAEKTFHRDDAVTDQQGRVQYFMEADEKEALFYLIYEINSSARSLRAGFYDRDPNP